MSDFSHQVVRGIFDGKELEALTWEVSWLDWEESDGYFLFGAEKKLPKALNRAAYKLELIFPGTEFSSARLEKYTKGQSRKVVVEEWKKGEARAIFSLSQFRGGKTMLGSFNGYINPGEALYSHAKEDSTCESRIDKVISGEMIMLILSNR